MVEGIESAEEWTLLKTKSEWRQMEDQTMLEKGGTQRGKCKRRSHTG